MVQKYRLLMIAGALAVVSSGLHAQGISDLTQILADARANDPTYQASKLRLEAELEKLPEARALLFPQINANVTGNEVDETLSAPDAPFVVQGNASYGTHSYGVTLRQVIFDPAVFSQVKRARLEAEIAKAGIEIANQDLLLRAAQGYFQVLLAKDNVELSEANLKSSEEQFRQVDGRFNVGLATRSEHQDALARWQRAIASDIVNRNSMQNVERLLEVITGSRYSDFANLPADTPVAMVLEGVNRESWMEAVRNNNLSLYQQRLRLEVAGRSLDIQKAGHYPTLQAVVDHRTNVNDGSLSGATSRNKNTNASLQLNIPIFSGGLVRSRVRSARYEYEATLQDLENTQASVEREAQALLDQVASQKQTVEALGKAVEATETALKAKQEGFKAGLETNLDVLDAQRDLFQTSLDYNQARYDTLVLRLQLEQIAGNLSEMHLGQLNGMLVAPEE